MAKYLPHLPHLVFALLCLLNSAAAQTNGTVSVPASLSATGGNSRWVSPSGDFAFGFRQINGTDLFLLSIWFDKIPDKTIVWYANGDSPAPEGSKVELTTNNGLVLSNPQGQELWKSQIGTSGSVVLGVMNDTGNFVLKTSDSENLWESFKNPTDTMLPSQIMERGGFLFSRKSDTNFSKGRFEFRLLQNGDLKLSSINLPTNYANSPYYRSGTGGDANLSSSGIRLVFNESGILYVLRENNPRLILTEGQTVSASNIYHRAVLNFDGVFTQYYHPKSSSGDQSWTQGWFVPDNICMDNLVEAGSGTCGYNSVCTLDGNSRPNCRCPNGYTLLDPSDQYGSCIPDFVQGCEEDLLMPSSSQNDIYTIVERINVDWPLSDYVLLEPFTAGECSQACLNDCMCAVSIFGSGKCWKKKLPLSNGREDPSVNRKAFIKVRKDDASQLFGNIPEKKQKNQDGLNLTGLVLLGSSLFFNILLGGAICAGFYLIYYKKMKRIPHHEGMIETNLRCFSYKELVQATDGFKEELGRGAFGIVYKGAIQMSSNILIAVKKLNTSVFHDGIKEFKTEVNVIGQTHHKNLVRLLGFCDDGEQRLLVYEFLSNGTLANFLFGGSKSSWNQRVEIALGIARGLLYLHEECSTQIIHCDIKPQNILLDDYNNARISDFGLAKLLLMDQSHTQTAIRGTKGYVAPEWFRSLPITVKVDVYSYGVLLLEIICCRRTVDMDTPESEKAILTDWAYDCYVEGTLDVLVEHDTEALDNKGELESLVMVALWCIQEDPSLRPTMRKVVQMLEGAIEVPVPPCPFRLSTHV